MKEATVNYDRIKRPLERKQFQIRWITGPKAGKIEDQWFYGGWVGRVVRSAQGEFVILSEN